MPRDNSMETSAKMDQTAGGELFRKWTLYESIILENWMRHRDISSAMQRVLAKRNDSTRVLDLGCGDGWMATESLRVNQVTRYVGVDLSQAALDINSRGGGFRTSPQPVQMELFCEDMTSVVARLAEQTFDIVLASYSIHHLPSDIKQVLLGHISRVLVDRGCFLWTDLVCQPGESPKMYLQRLTQHIDTHWTRLPTEERRSAIEHINSHDYPEQSAWMITQAAQHGLRESECLYLDDYFGCWQFVKVAGA